MFQFWPEHGIHQPTTVLDDVECKIFQWVDCRPYWELCIRSFIVSCWQETMKLLTSAQWSSESQSLASRAHLGFVKWNALVHICCVVSLRPPTITEFSTLESRSFLWRRAYSPWQSKPVRWPRIDSKKAVSIQGWLPRYHDDQLL